MRKHSSAQTHFLDIIIRQRTPILQLLAGEDQTLLVGGDALFVLYLRLYVVDGVGGLDFEGDGFAREGFDEAGFVRLLRLMWRRKGGLHLHWG